MITFLKLSKSRNYVGYALFSQFALCQKWGSNPRPQSWTRILGQAKSWTLKSGALDHSAILTLMQKECC